MFCAFGLPDDHQKDAKRILTANEKTQACLQFSKIIIKIGLDKTIDDLLLSLVILRMMEPASKLRSRAIE